MALVLRLVDAAGNQIKGDSGWSRLSEQIFRFDKWSPC